MAAATTLAQDISNVVGKLKDALPAEALQAFQADIVRFETQGVPSTIPSVGSPFPDASLLDAHGKATSIAATRNGKPAVLVFYRGAWCPYCNVALRAYEQKLLPTLTQKGIVLIAISPQKPDESLTLTEKNALTFPVLSDPGNQLAHKLGTVVRHSDDSRKVQAGLGIDVSQTNVDGTYDVPMPAVFVLDGSGKVKWSEVHANYAKRTEPADILKAVEGL